MSTNHVNTPERPSWNKQMAHELAQVIGKVLHKWSGDDGSTLERCVNDCEDIFEIYHDEDGYQIAKELEDKGYSPDTELVDDLDIASYEASKIKTRHIQEWVTKNNLTLQFTEGNEVKFRNNRFDSLKAGKVVKLYPETLQLGIRTPEQKETQHYVVNQELIETTIESSVLSSNNAR